MHEEILTDEQKKLLPIVRHFSNDYFLVGGTAIALQIGHRLSIDFDLFTEKEFDNGVVAEYIITIAPIEKTQTDQQGQFTFYVNGVQFTFMKYRFKIPYNVSFGNIIKMPDLLTLGAMKLHALGRRAKWKDYVDLYFISKKYSLQQMVKKSEQLFGNEFNEKLFRVQLAYFDDVDYSEEVEYIEGFQIPDSEVKKSLEKISL